ncbi:MAG: RagB/SusD family nutrient uptake outer membrane protein [Prevotellaceae bacterium]|jgi:hypothetical protein|nr:RagB/SusD family nutrient uptake outer membrane protein [Prevotellaceae bacterium]
MKKIKIFLIIVMATLCCSCNDFLTIYPENSISSDEFLSSEKDLELYANGFLNAYLPNQNFVFSDQYTDYIATVGSTAFLIADAWRPEQQGGWGWGELRNINWFLNNLHRAKDNVSPEIYNHYEGVGRFWRAYFYYDKVRTFGDVPWYDRVLEPDDEAQLYKPRDSREYVMDKVLEDLNFAAEYCSTNAVMTASSNRITRWVALAFKARICLFEGTYRKYHTELNLTSSAEKFLREAVSACEIVMRDGPYRLVTGGDVKKQYRSLFISANLNTTEVILGRTYKEGVSMHELTWMSFTAAGSSRWSLIKQFVNQYLMLDGSRFTDQTGYETMSYTNEFTNRDNRLAQTVIAPDYVRKLGGVDNRPYAPRFNVTLTGYQLIKWGLDDDKYDSQYISYNSLPILRYAEVLLSYAEAKAELGEMDETVWNQTIRLLRERAGVNGAVPATHDPYLATYYLNQTTDKWILEIRRERAIELCYEWVRYDDLMRWKMGKLIEMPWYGIYIGAKDTPYDLNSDGITDLTISDSGSGGSDRIVIGDAYQLTEGNRGYLVYGAPINRMWTDRKYLHPIPTGAIQINPALGQNPGWE